MPDENDGHRPSELEKEFMMRDAGLTPGEDDIEYDGEPEKDDDEMSDKELDKVDDDELDGKHKDRKDKDIDNDGDTDESDKYLHKRRKAIDKAVSEAFDQLNNTPVDLGESVKMHKAAQRGKPTGSTLQSIRTTYGYGAAKKAGVGNWVSVEPSRGTDGTELKSLIWLARQGVVDLKYTEGKKDYQIRLAQEIE